MKDPAVLFYTADFLAGVMFMSMKERGEYITLLCIQHQQGVIPMKAMRAISPKVRAKFRQDENGNFFNERMQREIEKRASFNHVRKYQTAFQNETKPFSAEEGERDDGHGVSLTLSKSENRNENRNGNRIFIIPSLDEVRDYCAERDSSVNPEQWYSFYEANGFRVGKNPMKNWHASIRAWENRETLSRGGARNDTKRDTENDTKNESSFDLNEFFDLAVQRAKNSEERGAESEEVKSEE